MKIDKNLTRKHSNKKKYRKKKREQSSIVTSKKRSLDIFLSLCISIIICLCISFFFFSIEKMTGNSMAPLLTNKECLVFSRDTKNLERFDIVVIKKAKKTEIRRIIGLPGETIRYRDDYLYIDDQEVTEKFIINQINEYGRNGKVYTQSDNENDGFQVGPIPPDYFLVLGDNRPYATDSRQYGLVNREDLKGKGTLSFPNLKRID